MGDERKRRQSDGDGHEHKRRRTDAWASYDRDENGGGDDMGGRTLYEVDEETSRQRARDNIQRVRRALRAAPNMRAARRASRGRQTERIRQARLHLLDQQAPPAETASARRRRVAESNGRVAAHRARMRQARLDGLPISYVRPGDVYLRNRRIHGAPAAPAA